MGMTKAKSLLEVKDGRTFLDLIAEQILDLRERSGARLPLVLMNSFATRADSLAALERYDDLSAGLPADFVQNKVPKLRADDLTPVQWPDDPALEWAPPGHGDLYTALVTSGMLEALLDDGYRYAFVSNSDNLGAVLDPRILAWLAREQRAVPDGGRRPDLVGPQGRPPGAAALPTAALVLREIAQTPDEDVDAFQDTSRHRYFNTNTLWVDLHALRDLLSGARRDRPADDRQPQDRRPGRQGLDARHPAGDRDGRGDRRLRGRAPRCACRARASCRSRPPTTCCRCAPTPTSSATGRAVHLAPERDGVPPFVDLDGDHYKLVGDFDARFPAGAPSLVGCEALHVVGRRALRRRASSCAAT